MTNKYIDLQFNSTKVFKVGLLLTEAELEVKVCVLELPAGVAAALSILHSGLEQLTDQAVKSCCVCSHTARSDRGVSCSASLYRVVQRCCKLEIKLTCLS